MIDKDNIAGVCERWLNRPIISIFGLVSYWQFRDLLNYYNWGIWVD